MKNLLTYLRVAQKHGNIRYVAIEFVKDELDAQFFPVLRS